MNGKNNLENRHDCPIAGAVYEMVADQESLEIFFLLGLFFYRRVYTSAGLKGRPKLRMIILRPLRCFGPENVYLGRLCPLPCDSAES